MKKAKLINPELLDPEMYDEHKVEECAETLLEAEEIKKDAVLMKKIKEHLAKKSKKIESLKDLKAVASNFTANNMSEDDEE